MKFFNDKDKVRISLGVLIGLLIYFTLSIIVKLCGLDLFTVTTNIPILMKFNDFVMSNVFIEDLFKSILFTIETIFVYGICGRIYKIKPLVILGVITLIISYAYNLLVYFYNFPVLILTVIIPLLIIVLYSLKYTNNIIFKNSDKNTKIKSVLTALVFYIFLSIFIILIQQGLFYLKFNLIKFSYLETNIFNVILFDFDVWVIYFSIYICCKILNKGEENNGK